MVHLPCKRITTTTTEFFSPEDEIGAIDGELDDEDLDEDEDDEEEPAPSRRRARK